MRLKRLDGACYGGTCPTLYESDRGTIVVQGWKVTDAEVDVPDGEAPGGDTARAAKVSRECLISDGG